jgi:hypothetical protein
VSKKKRKGRKFKQKKNLSRHMVPFVSQVASLQKACRSKDINKILFALLLANGLAIVPAVLFEDNGVVRDVKELEMLLAQQLVRGSENLRDVVLETNFENVAHGLLEHWKTLEERATPREDDLAWFANLYGFVPVNTNQVRAALLAHDNKDLHAYVNSRGEPWSNLEQQVAVMRLG